MVSMSCNEKVDEGKRKKKRDKTHLSETIEHSA